MRLLSLMSEHSHFIARQLKGVTNLLNLQLYHVTKKLMTDRSQANFAEYEAIKLKVNNWYFEERRELFLKCKALLASQTGYS